MKNLTLKVRKVLLCCLFALMTACLVAVAFFGGNIASAATNPIAMRGASVRISSKVAGEYGLRFGTLIEKSYLDTMEKADDFEVGMLYIPTDLLDGELTVSTATVGKMVLTNNAVEETVNNTAYYSYRGYIRNMPASEYDREISARTYVLNNGEYAYADEISRSTLYTARAEYEAVAENQEVIQELYFTPYVAAKITHEGGSTTLNSDNTLQVSVPHYAVTGIHVAKTLDTYKAGTYVMTEFVGANMIPTIFFGVNETGTLRGLTTGNDYHNIGLTGVGIYAGVAAGSTRYVYRATSTETATSVGLKNYYNYGYLVTKNTGHYGDAATTACDKTYVLVIGADTATGGVNVEHMLFEKNAETGELTLVESVTQLVEGATLNRGSIVFGSATNTGIDANFKLYTPDTKEAIIEKLGEEYGYYIPTMSTTDFILSNASASVSVSDNNTTDTKADDYYSIKLPSTNVNETYYAKTVETYEPGTYILSEFVGVNMIPTIFFGVTDIGSVKSTTANDYLNMGFTGVGIFAGVNAAQPYYAYRASSTGAATATHGYLHKYNYGYLVTNNTGWYGDSATGNSVKTFVLLMGSNNVSDGANLDYSLFEKNTTTGELTLVETRTQVISGAVLNEGSILFGSATNASNTANFKLYTPDTKANLINLMADVYGYDDISSSNVEFSSGTHTITDVETGKVNITMTHNVTMHKYAKTVINYKPGTYALLEFAGNGAPRNIFFGSTNVSEAAQNNYYATGISGFGLTADSNWGTEGYAYIDGTLVKATASGATGKFDRGYLTASHAVPFPEIPTDETEKAAWIARNYVMLVGAVQDGADVKIEYTLWLNDNGTLTEIQTKEFVFANQTLETGSIVFTPSVKTGDVANFNLYTPDTKANLLTKIDSVYGTYLSEGAE